MAAFLIFRDSSNFKLSLSLFLYVLFGLYVVIFILDNNLSPSPLALKFIRKDKSYSRSHHGKAGLWTLVQISDSQYPASFFAFSVSKMERNREYPSVLTMISSSLPRALLGEAFNYRCREKIRSKITAFTSPSALANTRQSDILKQKKKSQELGTTLSYYSPTNSSKTLVGFSLSCAGV